MSNNGIVNIHGKQYVTVAKRVNDAHKDGKLQGVKTEVLQFEPVIVLKATVNIGGVEYTGISAVDPSKAAGPTEKSNPYEVAETSAVGRALAFAGYEVELGIASADEMVKAQTVTHQVGTPTAKTTVTTGSTTPKCEIHGKFMKERTRKDGTTWFDHRWQDEQGEWNQCNGKPKMTDEEELSMDQAVEY